MIVYNVTVKMHPSIASEWLQWMQDEHIPDMLRTNCFTAYTILRLIDIDESEGPTYAIQYQAESKADYNRYIELHSGEMRRRSFEKWGDAFIAFRTVMEVVQ
jgi:hypothetical protein